MGLWVNSLASAVITKICINISLGIINTIAEALMVEMAMRKNIGEEPKTSSNEESKGDSSSPESEKDMGEYHRLADTKDENKELIQKVSFSERVQSQSINQDDVEASTEDDSSQESKKHQENATSYVSIFLVTTYLFTMIALWMGGFFLDRWNKQLIFLITGAFCFIPFAAIFIIYEKRRVTVEPSKKYKKKGGM